MVRRVGRRLGVAISALLIALSTPVAAFAAPAAPPPPPSITITGEGLAKPLNVRADADSSLFSTVMEQVSWLGGAGQTNAPTAKDLGPKYTVVVLAGDVPKQTYDLYPLAKGGPRACRPAKQPDQRRSTASAAWFYGRLSMSESLLAAGVPLAQQEAPIGGAISGGVGGGERVVSDKLLDPRKDLDDMFSDLRQLLLLNAAVIIVITLGLAGISLLVRRRTR
jgi:hypothetical protein